MHHAHHNLVVNAEIRPSIGGRMSVSREFHLREERSLLSSPLCHPDDSVLLLKSPLFEILRSSSANPGAHITSVIRGEAHAANCRTHSITRSHSQLETLGPLLKRTS